GRENPCIKAFNVANVQVLKVIRHQRKLQIGGLSGNRFTLTIRNIRGGENFIGVLQQRLESLKAQGVPNYFGAQRFGLYGRNIKQGLKFLAGELPKVKRNQKGLYLSALRSWMFNVLLSQRIEQGNWNQFVPGEVLQLQGSNKWFIEDASSDLNERVRQQDLHPTGALYGKGVLPSQQEAFAIEEGIAELFSDWIFGLEQYGVQQDRRALRVLPEALTWQWLDDKRGAKLNASNTSELVEAFKRLGKGEQWMHRPALQLSFTLRAGSYATMVLRELLLAEDYQVLLKRD
ncbi:tRNA pseudouridine(13) synthase, partial [hydrothermal vent metagenome]